MRRIYFGLALTITSLLSGETVRADYTDFRTPIPTRSFVSAPPTSTSSAAGLTPLKVSDFVTIDSYTVGEGEDSWEMMHADGFIDAKYMRKIGFTLGKKRRYIRRDVTVWEGLDMEGEDCLGGSIYLKFKSEEAAKAFMKTCDEFGWDDEDPDFRGNGSNTGTVSVRREGLTVRVGWDNT